jgi:aspartate aminotransferase-like enzyme
MRERTERWAETCKASLGDVGILAPAGARSYTVSAVTLPAAIDGKRLVTAMTERGWTIGGGYGPLASRTIRIGHMGDHTVAGLERCLAMVEEVMGEMGRGSTD